MKTKRNQELTFGDLLFDFFPKGRIRLNQTNGLVDRIKIGLGMAMLAALTGCLGWTDEGGVYGGMMMTPEPDYYLFGSDYGWGRDAYGYGYRGFESRRQGHFGGGWRGRGGAMHGGGGHGGVMHGGGGHAGGGHGGRR
ncbi:MAG: hypothetical protein ACYDH9_21135 [Limisphaerales bacterium]